MASRLYAPTLPLFEQILALLASFPLGLPSGRLQWMALYITGLILLDRDQRACRITPHLPGRAHDAPSACSGAWPFGSAAWALASSAG